MSRLGRAVRVFRGEHQLHIDLIGRRRLWFLLSGAAVALAIVGLLGPGLNLGIDFRGGTVLTFDNQRGASTEDVQALAAEHGHDEAVVQVVRSAAGDPRITVRVTELGDERDELVTDLEERVGPLSAEDTIGAKWGEQISSKAMQGLVIFLIAVSIYISFRFEWKMAAGGISALFHDLAITAGVYAWLGREVTPETVIALLTILGYSLYDTVVIFDRIKENVSQVSIVQRETYAGTVNLSLNQVLMRSFNTTLTTLFPIGALMLFGGETLQNFAFALFVGVLLGGYSSVFVAAPLVAVLKEREPRMSEIRQRAERRDSRPSRVATGDGEDRRELVTATAPRRPSGSSQSPRRKPKKKPRSKRKRR